MRELRSLRVPIRAAGIMACIALATCNSPSQDAAQSSSRNPDNASRLRVALAAETAGQFDIALSMYAAAVQASPSDVEAQSRYAAVLVRMGRPTQADEALTRALASRPQD